MAVVAWRDGRAIALSLGIFVAALVIAPVVVVAWLAAKGALAAWREIVFDYLLPLYARLGRPDRWTFHRWHVWIPIAAGVLLSVGSALAHRRFTARHAVVTLGLAYGVVHYFGQGRDGSTTSTRSPRSLPSPSLRKRAACSRRAPSWRRRSWRA